MTSLPRATFSSFGLLIVWGLVIGSGMLLFETYSFQPGPAGSPPTWWPEDSLIPRDADRSTLLIFLHPRCPCSQASVEELAYILSQTRRRVTAHALLLSPTHPWREWGPSGVEEALAALPDLRALPDKGGAEARRFGAQTSGNVVLYDAQGRLTFSGGITAARGHRGNNEGRAAVIDRINGKGQSQSWFPVFGCPLADSEGPVDEERRR